MRTEIQERKRRSSNSSRESLAREKSAQEIWTAAQEHLRSSLSADTYSLWFAQVQSCSVDNDALVLLVSNDFCEVWLKDNYLGLLQDVVSLVAGRTLAVQLRVASPGKATNGNSGNRESERKAVEDPGSRAIQHVGSDSFDPNSTFENFVVGNNNNFSYAAALAISQSPGKSYNPLFVYGGVGLGKTHLLHAIGQLIIAKNDGSSVAYRSSEMLVNEYIDALQNNQLVRFRKKYREIDVLLIDDIQFLAGREGIQQEFFNTFNALLERKKQIVLTCDRPASEIQNLEYRLVSRFEWGLVTDLQPPDIDVRLAILNKKAKIMGVTLPAEIMSFLANRIRSNIRRLEGALNRVTSYASLTGKVLTVEVVEGLLREILHEEGRFSISLEVIQKIVAEHFDIRFSDMTSKQRPENIAFPRQIAMFLCRQMTEASLASIGEAFGGRNRSVVLHGCRLVKDRMEIDPSVRQVVSYLERRLMR